jgi:D-alanyl-D-alanine carboxypeptidase (penicillin-binding protein 5/6)
MNRINKIVKEKTIYIYLFYIVFAAINMLSIDNSIASKHKNSEHKKSNLKGSKNKTPKTKNNIKNPAINSKLNQYQQNKELARPIDRKIKNIEYLTQNSYFLLMDYPSKEVLISRNENEIIAPSSMTKIMTAFILFDNLKKEKIKLENQCVIGTDAWRKRGSSMFLNYGDIVSIEDLLKGLLVVSGNDAAIAIAEAVGGGYDNFIKLMNEKAQEIGLTNSHFTNPHGLNEPQHYMTLKDLAILMARIYQDFPEYVHYLALEDFTYRNITQKNRNPLIKESYEGLIGGKTGHTNDGGYGIVGAVKRNNRILVGVVNKASNPQIRAKLINAIFDYGFEDYKKLELFNKNEEISNLKIWLGKQDNVGVVSKKDISINIPSNIDLKDVLVKIEYKGPIYAPVQKGEQVANLIIEVKNYKKFEYPLFASSAINKVHYIRKIIQILKYKIKI